MDYKLYAVRVFVTDWDRAIAFYTETLGIPTTVRDDAHGWAQLATGEGQLALERAVPDDAEAVGLVGRFVGVSLEVADVNAAYATLVQRGVEFLGAPVKQPWGGTLVHLRDPDGNVITLLGAHNAVPA